MRDDTDESTELNLLRAQRAQLASRLKAPWWYYATIAVIMALTCAAPIGAHYLRGVADWGTVLAIVVFYVLQQALAQASGVAVGTRTLQYPSGRTWGIAVIAVIVAACVAETLLVGHGLLSTAIAVGVLATLAGTGFWQGHLRGIRRDLETGQEAV